MASKVGTSSKRRRSEAVSDIDDNGGGPSARRARDRDQEYSLLLHSVEDMIGELAGDEEDEVVLLDDEDAGDASQEADDYSDEDAPARTRRPSVTEDLVFDRERQHQMHLRVARAMHGDDDNSDDAESAAGRARSNEIQIQRLKSKVAEMKIQRDMERQQAALQKDALELEKNRLLRQLKFLEDEEKGTRELLQRKSEEWLAERKKLMHKMREMQKELKQKETAETQPSRAPSTPSVSSSSSSSLPTAMTPGMAEAAMRRTLQELREARDLNVSLEEQVNRLKAEVAQLKTVGPTMSLSSNEEFERLEAMCRQLRQQKQDAETQLRQKDRELQSMRSRIQNQALLEEQVEALKQAAVRHNQDRSNLEKLQQENDDLQRERQEWKAQFEQILANDEHIERNFSDESIPHAVLNVLSQYQQTCRALMKQDSDLKEELSQALHQVELLERELTAGRDRRRELTTKLDDTSGRLAALEAERKLYDQEIQRMRDLVKTYDREFALTAPTESAIMKAKDKQIEDLQRQCDEARQTMLEVTMARQAMSDKRIAELNQENAELSQQLKRYQDAKAAGITGGSGASSSGGAVRVVHMAHNPYALAKKQHEAKLADELQQLREENHRLRDMVMRNTSDADQVEGNGNGKKQQQQQQQQQQAQTVDSGKLNLRLKEMFRERIKWFREAVYLLTGYKIDLLTSGEVQQVRLRSMFAESEDEFLLFQVRGDALELLDTPYAGSLDQRLFAYLTTCNSVPAFLSGLTLELFEKQTFLP